MRIRFLIPMLAIAAGLIWLNVHAGSGADVASAVVPPVQRQAQATPRHQPRAEPGLQMPQERVAGGDIGNPFVAKSWYVQPPAPPVVAVTPPPPSAPPLPFGFAGALEAEPGHTVYYLVVGDQSYGVSKGETFAGQYRLDGVENGQLVIVYLPLATKQFLPMNTDS